MLSVYAEREIGSASKFTVCDSARPEPQVTLFLPHYFPRHQACVLYDSLQDNSCAKANHTKLPSAGLASTPSHVRSSARTGRLWADIWLSPGAERLRTLKLKIQPPVPHASKDEGRQLLRLRNYRRRHRRLRQGAQPSRRRGPGQKSIMSV